ncbi:MAG TPA: polyprenyl synthetase family protein [Dermatophilaceae bacterium]|nr:polyprenyl synthetase family protein [Dermatophilaceae bacterium]
MVHATDLADLRARIQVHIDQELARQREILAESGGEAEPLVAAIASLLRGGKRLRAAFCYWGYLAAGGGHLAGAERAAVAMEFFQAAALLHDDVMDDSAIRRGMPSAHRALAAAHADAGWDGDADRFGTAGAILAGDLCLVWSDEVLTSCGLPPEELSRSRPIFDAMRSQLMAGQFLDVLVSVRGWRDLSLSDRLGQARRVIRYKSAKYSVEQPVLFGARAAGADPSDLTHLSRFGLDLGEAFQLRDDVLGVFGDPDATGKPAGDDLREGKRTVLLALALDGASLDEAARLEDALGRPDLTADQVEALRDLIAATGALDRLEARIGELTCSARHALAASERLLEPGRAMLDHLVDVATARVS